MSSFPNSHEESVKLISDLTSERDSALVDLQIALEERDAARKKERAAHLQKQAAVLEKEAAVTELEAFKLREKSITTKLNSLILERDAAVSKFKAAHVKLRALILEKEAVVAEKEAAILSRDKAISHRDNAILKRYEEAPLCLDWKEVYPEEDFADEKKDPSLEGKETPTRKEGPFANSHKMTEANGREENLESGHRTKASSPSREKGSPSQYEMDVILPTKDGGNAQKRKATSHEGQSGDRHSAGDGVTEYAFFDSKDPKQEKGFVNADLHDSLDDLALSNYGDSMNEMMADSNLPRTPFLGAQEPPNTQTLLNRLTTSSETLAMADESTQMLGTSFKDRKGDAESNGYCEEGKRRKTGNGEGMGDKDLGMADFQLEMQSYPFSAPLDKVGKPGSPTADSERHAKGMWHSPFPNKWECETKIGGKRTVKKELEGCSSEETEDERLNHDETEDGKMDETDLKSEEGGEDMRKDIQIKYSWDLENSERHDDVSGGMDNNLSITSNNVNVLELGSYGFPISSTFPSMRFPISSVRRGGTMNYDKLSINMLEVEEIIGDAPLPYCSCTDEPHTVYKIGEWGFQSSCCTAHISLYPLPYNDKGRRLSGRRMSRSAFAKVLLRIAGNGGDITQPVDLRDFWGKHGRTVF